MVSWLSTASSSAALFADVHVVGTCCTALGNYCFLIGFQQLFLHYATDITNIYSSTSPDFIFVLWNLGPCFDRTSIQEEMSTWAKRHVKKEGAKITPWPPSPILIWSSLSSFSSTGGQGLLFWFTHHQIVLISRQTDTRWLDKPTACPALNTFLPVWTWYPTAIAGTWSIIRPGFENIIFLIRLLTFKSPHKIDEDWRFRILRVRIQIYLMPLTYFLSTVDLISDSLRTFRFILFKNSSVS